jgi:hypothetical protein
MKYKVLLTFHNDYATGEWGLLPKNSIKIDEPFNSFWTHQGIFHDIFEHHFEGNNKYFQNNYAFNIGGEVAAMGHLAYYYFKYYLEDRWFSNNSIYSRDEQIIHTTFSDMQEGIVNGYFHYGDKLECNVPRVLKKDYKYHLETIVDEHSYKIRKTLPKKESGYHSMDFQRQKDYKRSITYSKLKRLYYWGWKNAEKIAPYSEENRDKLKGFLNYWKNFTSHYKAEEVYGFIKDIEFTVKGGEKFNWDCIFITHEGQKIKKNNIEEYL